MTHLFGLAYRDCPVKRPLNEFCCYCIKIYCSKTHRVLITISQAICTTADNISTGTDHRRESWNVRSSNSAASGIHLKIAGKLKIDSAGMSRQANHKQLHD